MYKRQDKKRADIVFLSVIKNQIDNTYLIYGKTFLEEIKTEFQGVIEINKIQSIINHKNRFLMIGKFNFYEKNKEKIIAIEGNCYFKIIIDKKGARTDLTTYLSDANYYNNAFLGERYNLESPKCKTTFNWANIRPPLAGDLDIGEYQFLPNPEYSKKGWESLIEAYNKKGGGILFDKKYDNWWN